MAIPKIIHFCWLSGDEYPELIRKCTNSWKEKMPDYQIMIWDTKLFDVNINKYTQEAFSCRKYAFVSDYIRLYALYNYGGIYLDSDIEVLKSFNDLLDQKAFTGFENDHTVAAWIFGSEKANPLFKELLEYYDDKAFIKENGDMDLTPNTIPVTETLLKHGLKLDGSDQVLDYIHIFPSDFFCPYTRATETLNITDNTYSIHYFNGAWISDNKKNIIMKRKKIISKYGKIFGYIYYGLAVIRHQGYKQFLNEFKAFLR